LRLLKAAGMLRDEGAQASLARVAEAVGYETEAAFSKAFKRFVGESPGAYRRAATGSILATRKAA
jgi:AraC-like DNA-binding protein